MKITSLSPSMVNQYLKCPRSFYYNYALKLPWLPNHYLAFGAAFHETLRENYWQKIQTAEDLPVDLLADFFRDDLEYRDVDWSAQSKDVTKDEGIQTVRAYQKKVAPKVQPKHVEYAFQMEVTGRDWQISGKIDLINDNLLVMENKTTGRRVSKPKPDHVFQTGVYTSALRKQNGNPELRARIDYSIRGSDAFYSFPIHYDDSLEKNVLTTFDQVARGIQLEVWPANRIGNYLCSRRYCNFWNQCEQDCGGRVAE